MEESKTGSILKLILGNKEYTQLITDTVREYKNMNWKLDDAELIIETYFMAILLIGFSKKQIQIDKYRIHLLNEVELEINTKEFCKKYEKYIDKVENYKFDLLRQLL